MDLFSLFGEAFPNVCQNFGLVLVCQIFGSGELVTRQTNIGFRFEISPRGIVFEKSFFI